MRRFNLFHLAPLAYLATGCSSPGHASPKEAFQPQPTPSAQVEATQPQGNKYILTEIIAAQTHPGVLRRPARSVFQDNALARLSAPLKGRVVEVKVQSGASVKQGDPLLTIDCPEAAATYAALLAARAVHGEAKATFERQAQMLEDGVGTKRDLLVAERNLNEASANLQREQATARYLGNTQGSRLTIRAPISGNVINLNTNTGAIVDSPEEVLIEVGKTDAIWVVADLFERDAADIALDTKATIHFTRIDETLTGTVTQIGHVVDPDRRIISVRIELNEVPPHVKPGMYGFAQFEVPERRGIELPTQAVLIREGGETVVYIAEGDKYQKRRVTIEQSAQHDRVLITSGVSPGERVVTKGALLLDSSADQLL